MTNTPLGPGREFDLIRRALENRPPLGPPVLVGPGDDAAVVRAAAATVVSTDLTVEGIHFRSQWMSPKEVGGRATTAALSDLAAMAARPLGILLSYAVDRARADDWVPALTEGAGEVLDRFGCGILGGDLSAAPQGSPVVIDVVAVGETDDPCTRSGAKPGDTLWVTGHLGLPALAVRAWEMGEDPPPEARERFVNPIARVAEARWLRERLELTAMIDLSDGLVADVGHIAAASRVHVTIDATRLPIANTVRQAMDVAALRFAATGGEEYELCFSAPAGSVELVVDDFRSAHGIDLTCVGEVTSGAGVGIVGIDVPELDTGHDHFRTSG